MNIFCRILHFIFVNEIYVEDLIRVIDEMTPQRDQPLNLGLFNSNLLIELDYYPTDYWEWAWVRLDNVNYGCWSSSYDKGSNLGFVNLGYNKWIHISWKYENGTITMTANNNTTSVNVDKELPFDVDFYSNRNGTKYKNLKVKSL